MWDLYKFEPKSSAAIGQTLNSPPRFFARASIGAPLVAARDRKAARTRHGAPVDIGRTGACVQLPHAVPRAANRFERLGADAREAAHGRCACLRACVKMKARPHFNISGVRLELKLIKHKISPATAHEACEHVQAYVPACKKYCSVILPVYHQCACECVPCSKTWRARSCNSRSVPFAEQLLRLSTLCSAGSGKRGSCASNHRRRISMLAEEEEDEGEEEEELVDDGWWDGAHCCAGAAKLGRGESDKTEAVAAAVCCAPR
jgi:hypothetical protein